MKEEIKVYLWYEIMDSNFLHLPFICFYMLYLSFKVAVLIVSHGVSQAHYILALNCFAITYAGESQ